MCAGNLRAVLKIDVSIKQVCQSVLSRFQLCSTYPCALDVQLPVVSLLSAPSDVPEYANHSVCFGILGFYGRRVDLLVYGWTSINEKQCNFVTIDGLSILVN